MSEPRNHPLTLMLQGLSDLALNADPATQERLQSLQGQTLAIDCTLPAQRLCLEFTAQGLRITDAADDLVAHTMIRGNALDLATLMFSGNAPGGVTISGDTNLLQELSQIAGGYRPQLPDPLGLSGFGQELLGAASEGFNLLRAAANSSARQANEDIGGVFLKHSAFDDFLSELTATQLAVDRLSARIANLAQQRAAENPTSG